MALASIIAGPSREERRLKRDKVAKIARLSSWKNFVSVREKFDDGVGL